MAKRHMKKISQHKSHRLKENIILSRQCVTEGSFIYCRIALEDVHRSCGRNARSKSTRPRQLSLKIIPQRKTGRESLHTQLKRGFVYFTYILNVFYSFHNTLCKVDRLLIYINASKFFIDVLYKGRKLLHNNKM